MASAPQRQARGRSQGSSEFRIGFLVHDVSRLRQTLFDQAMKPHGVTRAQWWALAQLTRYDPSGGMTQAELARLLGLGKVAVGGMIDRLEAAGLVVRKADAADRRINRVYVTARGSRVLDRMVAVGRDLNRSVLRGVSREDLEATDRVLTALGKRLRGMLDGAGE
ncbi:MarR family transcriptional regulator [Roseomonas eburnea]|uniref:MarR family transcriptional regulator n=1 Tax=Neoroseomonas eburnea TaxID=1346889 RepID=A0A9X9XH28_9PROT|nr:MarR family transcriptional regulator [Neoroseomonas eburnea]MBR0683014.1 MarR family transcriptional regulator [Neoroseomonas eburnea]